MVEIGQDRYFVGYGYIQSFNPRIIADDIPDLTGITNREELLDVIIQVQSPEFLVKVKS